MEFIRNSMKAFVSPKQLIWNGGTNRQTDRQTDRHTHTHTVPCIELRYAQPKIAPNGDIALRDPESFTFCCRVLPILSVLRRKSTC